MRPDWAFAAGVESGGEVPSIVNDGVVFVTSLESPIIAFDTKIGDRIWRYRLLTRSTFHNTNRWPLLWQGKVYTATLGAFLIAFDANTRKVL